MPTLMTVGALELASWLRCRTSELGGEFGPPTPLKLQKLVFYAYGAAVGHAATENAVDIIDFEPWTHGPVNRLVWKEYRAFGGDRLPPPAHTPASMDAALRPILDSVIEVYGRMSAWALRNESHLEEPWQRAFKQQQPLIADRALRRHFREKFALNAVTAPAHLVGAASSSLDFLPAARFPTLHRLADLLRASAA